MDWGQVARVLMVPFRRPTAAAAEPQATQKRLAPTAPPGSSPTIPQQPPDRVEDLTDGSGVMWRSIDATTYTSL